MDTFFNGAGVLVIISAPFMLIGLLLNALGFEGAISALSRRLAIILAVIIPLMFMLLVALFYPPDAQPQFDFNVNHQAALQLYMQGGDPYTVQAAYSFPAPTFYLYWLGSGMGALRPFGAWIVWWVINGILWVVCVLVLWDSLPPPINRLERDMLRYAAVAIPAVVTLWQGQTAILILAGLVALHVATLRSSRRLWLIVGGMGLAWAALIKPQLAFIGLGLAAWAILSWRAQRREDVYRIAWILISAALAYSAIIALTLIVPGGVSLDTYRQFFSEALPQVARPENQLVIGSPAFIGGAVVNALGGSEQITSLVGNVITLLMVGLALWWTFKRRAASLTEIAAGWGVWAMVIPRVAWLWYATWCLPFFLLFIREKQSLWRYALLVILLAIFNLQPSILLVAFAAILLLIGCAYRLGNSSLNPRDDRSSSKI